MPHTYAKNTLHIVFSTKDRRAAIPPEFQPEMWAYAAGVCQKIGIAVLAIGGIDNHMHMLLQNSRRIVRCKSGVDDQIEYFAVGRRTRTNIRVAARIWSVQR